ncbi:MAG: beta-lactamase family protein [Candidatus Thorarchaeota archaeon]|nr:beta-lactamase family protein [Candidatus Thorarchaeota archaeon]
MSEHIVKEIENRIQEMVDEDVFSGTVLIAKGEEVAFEKAYGFACKRFNVPNDVDTIYNIGSLNKQFTKIAILQLLQKGLLDLDDLVGKHIPDFKDEIASKVTIRHLLSFTSGLGDYFNDKFRMNNWNLRKLDDFVELFIDQPLQFEPGEERFYSNAGYVVLGKIVEAVSGLDYFDYIRKNIYEPAGMTHSDHYELDKPIPNLATGYTRKMGCCPDDEDGSLEEPRRNNNYVIGTRGSSAGGGHSTVRDLHRFDLALTGEQLLDAKHTKMAILPIGADQDSSPSAIALAGGAPGLSALYLKFFKAGYTVIVLSNYDPDDVEPLVNGIREIIVGKDDTKAVHRIHENESKDQKQCCGN